MCKYINFGIFFQNIFNQFLEQQEPGLFHCEDFHEFFSYGQIKENGMGGARGTHGREQNCIKGFGEET